MTISILKEPAGERRVVCLPEIAGQLAKMNFEVLVESGAGKEAAFSDESYTASGAKIVSRSAALNADLVLCITIPSETDLATMRAGAALLCVYQPLINKDAHPY